LHIEFISWKKRKKNDSTIERGKIWIPFIKLNVRPTSTLGHRRDQLVNVIVLQTLGGHWLCSINSHTIFMFPNIVSH
jgi:hypothetical protein